MRSEVNNAVSGDKVLVLQVVALAVLFFGAAVLLIFQIVEHYNSKRTVELQ